MISISFVTAWMVDHLGLRNKDGLSTRPVLLRMRATWGMVITRAWMTVSQSRVNKATPDWV